jgi:hypothetical protein
MGPLPRLAVLAVAVVVTAGCGSSGTASACGVLANGQKLCDRDLKAYCQKFERGALDSDTVQACAQVGVDVIPRSPPQIEKFTRACVAAGGDETDCEVAAEDAHAAGFPAFDGRLAQCVRHHVSPGDCVQEIVGGP